MITSAKYNEAGSILTVIDDMEMIVPDDMTNRHRQMIAEWESTGGVIDPYEAPPQPVPQVVSRFQARAALHIAGLLPQVETAIAAADPLVQMAWVDAQEFQRGSPALAAVAVAIGLSESELDELFITASGIVA